MPRKLLLVITAVIFAMQASAQTTGSFTVQGDFDKFYPVTFVDGGWYLNMATELELGRSSVHIDSQWRGSVISKFRFHINQYGNASHFIDADIRQYNYGSGNQTFIAGWADATGSNGSDRIIIWLRGGNTTYFYKSNYPVGPTVYDNVQNSLPYQEENGPAHNYKTALDFYVNTHGTSQQTAYYTGHTLNYFASQVGIGTNVTGPHRLAVDGSIGARKVQVTQNSWADFVFKPGYALPSLQEVAQYVSEHKHLPDMPAEEEVMRNGLDLGEMNKKLLQKVEELTLYLIEQQKRVQALESKNDHLEKRLQQLEHNR